MIPTARHYWHRFWSAQREHTARRGDLDDAPPTLSPLTKALGFMLAGLGFALLGIFRYLGLI